MLYEKNTNVQGNWIKAKELQNGMLAKLKSETRPMESVFEGKSRTQNVAKIQIKGFPEIKNVSINNTTKNALIDAFGKESKDWMDKELTIQIEPALIAGRRVKVLYLIPAGFEIAEDSGGYIVIVKIGSESIQEEPKEMNSDDIPF